MILKLLCLLRGHSFGAVTERYSRWLTADKRAAVGEECRYYCVRCGRFG